MLKFLKERADEYDVNTFVSELFDASKFLGILEGKIASYQFDGILIPLFNTRDAISTMYIEGTQTTISDIFEEKISTQPTKDKISIEASNHTRAVIYGSDYLRTNPFSHALIQRLHQITLDGIVPAHRINCLGRYKTEDNSIKNSVGSTVFSPPPYTETKRYMDELITFMNDTNDGLNPLIKAAIMHAQFESIHPFYDGNGRVGRLLIALYLYKAKVINFPFFYVSEAISQDKRVYYNMLTESRKSDYNEWIKFFLKKCAIQARSHISYIDSLNKLYQKTKQTLQATLNSPKFDQIAECLFTQPILTSTYLAERLNVSLGQARRYLDTLEKAHILQRNDWKRNTRYYFGDLLDLAR